MIVKLVLFASVKELVGESELEIEVAEEATVSQVKRHLAENYPLVEELLAAVRSLSIRNMPLTGLAFTKTAK